MATNSRQQVKAGTQKAKPKNPIFDNLVTQKVSPTGPSASGNSTNHLISTEPTCRSEAAFMFMFPQLSSLPGLVRSFSYSRILREQTALQTQAVNMEKDAKGAASDTLFGSKKGAISAETSAEGESSSTTNASIAAQHRVLMDAFNVDLSYEDNSVDPSDGLSIVFNMDDLTQACPTGTGKTNVNYLGKLSKPFILPVAYVEDLHQQDLFGTLAPKLNPASTGAKDDKQALSAVVTWKAFSFHNQFRRVQGGLNPLYALIGSRYITDWAATFSPALKARSTNILEANIGQMNLSSGAYDKLLKMRGLFTLSEYADSTPGTFVTGMHYKPGFWGIDLSTTAVVGAMEKKKIKTREYMDLFLKTKIAKKELEITPKQSADSTKAQRTAADVLRVGFEWQDYIDSMMQASKGAAGAGSPTTFDVLKTKYLPLIVKTVKDPDGSHIVSTVTEDVALEIAKSILVFGYEVAPLYELGIPKPKEMSLARYQEVAKGVGVSFNFDKNYRFLGTIATPKNAIPLPAAFDGFNFEKLWNNRDPQDKNYFDILQEDVVVSDLELYTMVNTVIDFYVRQSGGLDKFREAAFKNTPWLKNGSQVVQEMESYTRNDAKPPVPVVTDQKVDNYVPHSFSTVDGGKIIFGKKLVTDTTGARLDDAEIKSFNLMGAGGVLMDRMPGEVQLTSDPALVVGKPLPKEGQITAQEFVLSNAVFPVAPNSEQAKKDAEEAKKLQSDRQLIGEMAGFIQGKVAAPMRFDSVALGFDQGTTSPESEDGTTSNISIPVTTQKNYALNSILDGVLRIMFNPSILGTKLVADLISGAPANRTPGSKMFEFYINGGVDQNSIIVAEVGNRISFDWATRTGPLANELPTDLMQFVRPTEFNSTGGKFNRTFLTFALKGEPALDNNPATATYFVPGRETCYVDMGNLVASGSISELFADRLVAIYLKTPSDRLAPTGIQVHGHLVENLMAYYFWLCCLFVLKQFGAYPPGDLGNSMKATVGDKGYIPLDDFYTLVNITSTQNGMLAEVPVYPMYLDDMGKVKMTGNTPKPATTEFTLPVNFSTQVGMLQGGFTAKGALLNLGYRSVIPDISKLLNLKATKRLMLGGSFDPDLKEILSYDAQTSQENPVLAKNLANGQIEADRIADKTKAFTSIGTYYADEPSDLASTETSRNIDVVGPAIFDVSIEDVAVRPVVSSLISIKATGSASVPFAPGSLPQKIAFRPYYPRSFMQVHTNTDYAFSKTLPLIKNKTAAGEINLEALFLPKLLDGGKFDELTPATAKQLKTMKDSADKAVNTTINKSTTQIIGAPLTDSEVEVLKRRNESDLAAITAMLGSKLTNVASLMNGPLSFNSRITIHDTIGNPSYPMNTTTNGTKFDGGVAFGFRDQGETTFFPVDFASSIGALFSQSTIARGQRKALMQGLTHLYQMMLRGKRLKTAYPNAKNPLAGMYVGSTAVVRKPTVGGKDAKTNYYALVIPDIPTSGLPSKDDMIKGIAIASSGWKTGDDNPLDAKVFSTPPSYGIVSPGNVFGTYDVTDSALLPGADPAKDPKGNPDYHPPLLATDSYGYLSHYINGGPTMDSWKLSRHEYNKRYTAQNMDKWAALIDGILEAVKPTLNGYGVDADLKHKAVRFYATNFQLLKLDGSGDETKYLIPAESVGDYILSIPKEKLFVAGGAFESLPKTTASTQALVEEIMKVITGLISFPVDFTIWATNNEKQNLLTWVTNAWASSISINGNDVLFSPSAYYLTKIFSMTAAVWDKIDKRNGGKKNPAAKKFSDLMTKLMATLSNSPGGARWRDAVAVLEIIDPLLINGGLSVRYTTQKIKLGSNTAQLDTSSGKLKFEIGLAAFFAPGLADRLGPKSKKAGIGDFNKTVSDDISNISVSYGTLFVSEAGGKIPVTLFVSKSKEGSKRRVVTHTGTVFDNPTNPALSPFIVAGVVSGENDPEKEKIKLDGRPRVEKQFNILDRNYSNDSDANLSGIGFDVGEACRQYLSLRWWMKDGNAPAALRDLIKARAKNLFVMDFTRAGAEMALYLKGGNLPPRTSIFSLLQASYSADTGSGDVATQLRQTATSFGDSDDSRSLNRSFLFPSGSERRPYMPSYGAFGIPLATPRGESAAVKTEADGLQINMERTLPSLRFTEPGRAGKNLVVSDYENPKAPGKIYEISPQKVTYKQNGEIQESVDTDLLWLLWSLYSARLFVGTDQIEVKITSSSTIDLIDGPKPPDQNASFAKLDKIGELIDSGERADVLDNVVRF